MTSLNWKSFVWAKFVKLEKKNRLATCYMDQLGSFKNYVDKMRRGVGQKMSIFVCVRVNIVHVEEGEVKNGPKNCPRSY